MNTTQVLLLSDHSVRDEPPNAAAVIARNTIVPKEQLVASEPVLHLIGAANPLDRRPDTTTVLGQDATRPLGEPAATNVTNATADSSSPQEHEAASAARSSPTTPTGALAEQETPEAHSESSDDAETDVASCSIDHASERSTTPATSVEEDEEQSDELSDGVISVCDILPLLQDDGPSMPRCHFGDMVADLEDYDWARNSLFQPTRLPPSHPLLPFAVDSSHPNLEAPLRALPTILVVHDPSTVLPADKYSVDTFWNSDRHWRTRGDVVHVYRLHTGEAGQADAEERVAHLYLARDKTHGTGHHSFVYQAELDVARSLLPGYRPELGAASAVKDDEQDVLASSLPLRDPDFAGVAGLPPPIARVRVAAKLSIEGDQHLAHEARIYAKFPASLAQHREGTKEYKQLTCPVPLGAIVPQFYGYYVPNEESEDGEYLSPILLVEACGTPVEGKSLTHLEEQTTASLFLRLQDAGFVQNSEYPRNVLMQAGPLSRPPKERRVYTPSFRLIDFGRAVDREEFARAKRGEKGTHPFRWVADEYGTFDRLCDATWSFVRRHFL
ncbi:hypothetical protein HDZ31DRAFT_64780 [Schizophyllum fasciatum]